jgi:hypothetical protein
MADTTREPAPPDCVARIRQILPIGEVPPERWVALNAHGIILQSMFTYRYPDPEVDSYVQRVNELLLDHAGRDSLRREWLSPEEYEQVRREEEAGID